MAGNDRILRLILGDQLNAAHSWFERPDDRVTCLLMEIRPETDYVKHHASWNIFRMPAMMRHIAPLQVPSKDVKPYRNPGMRGQSQ
jgi:deoxyribodipyrimidine photolyase-related protein